MMESVGGCIVRVWSIERCAASLCRSVSGVGAGVLGCRAAATAAAAAAAAEDDTRQSPLFVTGSGGRSAGAGTCQGVRV